MSRKDKNNRRKAEKIDAYLEEYRQEMSSREALDSDPAVTEGIQDILEQFRENVSKATLGGGEGQTDAVSLVDKLTQEEREAFDPREGLENKGDVIAREVEEEAITVYQKATNLVLEAIRQAQEDSPPHMGEFTQIVEQMLDSLSSDSVLMLAATDRAQKFAVSSHCVNVAILALRLAQTLKRNREMQIKVGVAALLHEVGVVKLAARLVHSSGQVSSEVRQRPIFSAQILGKLGPEYLWLVETVGQVYEREDGSGYPSGLSGKDIREEAKILGVADVLEACIHDRPYRRALTGYQLFHELTAVGSNSFSDHIIKALLKTFSLYPYNEYVILNTGEIGKVIEVNPSSLLRPRVKLLYDGEGKPLREQIEVDLQNNPSRHITKAIAY
ncbi:HD domain-containing protein, partial [Acidobacteria bacterium AH-259-D05]|nr:HD domain-containing protein [Acidobacteria bacterium AH-259-D05]